MGDLFPVVSVAVAWWLSGVGDVEWDTGEDMVDEGGDDAEGLVVVAMTAVVEDEEVDDMFILFGSGGEDEGQGLLLGLATMVNPERVAGLGEKAPLLFESFPVASLSTICREFFTAEFKSRLLFSLLTTIMIVSLLVVVVHLLWWSEEVSALIRDILDTTRIGSAMLLGTHRESSVIAL